MKECVVDLSVASDALKPQTALGGEKRVLPGMQKQGGGSILFTSSVSAVEASPMPDFGYTAAKAALNAYAKKLAGTEAPNGVWVNALMPGSIEFPGGDWEKVQRHQPELYAMVQNSIPFRRLGPQRR